MSFDDAFKYYGTDRPDLRFGLKQKIVTDMFIGSGFSIFESVSQNKGLIKAFLSLLKWGLLAARILMD